MFRDLYLGTLYSTEHQKVFGYVTNTRVKFIIIVDNSNTNLRYIFYTPPPYILNYSYTFKSELLYCESRDKALILILCRSTD